MKKIEKLISLWPFGILTVVSIIAIAPFFNSGFFGVHDDTQVQRVFEMKKALSDGMFPVRWVPDLGYGYGYPIFNFYSPLPYYLGAILTLLGLDALFATKIMIVGAVVGSSFSMYLLARQFWGREGGLFSGVLYLYAPYHALNTYVRGDIGELYAYFFIPLIFYGIWKNYKTENYKYLLIGSLSYGGLITSHNLSAMMVSPFIILIVLILFAISKKNFLLLAIPILGILISSFYFLPALLEMNYADVTSTIGGKADFRDHFVCLNQLWNSPWMFGGSIPGCIDGLSFRLGKLHILFGLVGVLGALFFIRREREKIGLILLSFLGLITSLFLMLSYSKPIWEIIPYMDFFQYPWRFLLAASFFLSLIGGAILYYISKYLKANKMFLLIFLAILILTPVIFYAQLFKPQGYLNKSAEDYTNENFLKWETSKISDEYMPKSFKTPSTKEEIFREKIRGQNINVTNVSERTNYLSANIEVSEDTMVLVHIPYFPAWNYYLNEQKIAVREVSSGVSFEIPSGKNRLVVKFEQTPIEKSANLLSISGVGLIIIGIIYLKKRKKHEKVNS